MDYVAHPEKRFKDEPLSMPEYPKKYSGSVLICGSAWTLQEDFEKAKQYFGDIPAIAVNRSSLLVPAFAVFSAHSKLMPGKGWLESPFRNNLECHSSAKSVEQYKKRSVCAPHVDYWWLGINTVGGTSSWAAAKVAIFMGFEQVILCGVPIKNGNYADGRRAVAFKNPNIVKGYQKCIAEDTEWHPYIKSMSGFTRELLGSPC